MVEQRTALVNQVRGLAAEYGVIFPQGIQKLRPSLIAASEDADNGLSLVIRQLLLHFYQNLKDIDEEIENTTEKIIELCKQQPQYESLTSIPGFGPIITAALISEIGSGRQSSNGRQLSAWCGLVPKQHSSGGKNSLGGITKHGNKQLRTLLIHGARAVVRFYTKRVDSIGKWLSELIYRRGENKTVVALANKLARIGWAILSNGGEFNAKLAFK